MDKVTKQGVYLARCVFDSFVAGKMQDGDIQGPGDLLGWDDLAADDQGTKRSHPQPPPIVTSPSKDIPPLLPSPPSAAQPAGRCDHPPWSART